MKTAGKMIGFVSSLVLGVSFVQGGGLSATAFTYQGRLTDDGQAANGTYGFEVRMMDASLDGNQVGTTFCEDNILVSNGLFTLQLDFGLDVGDPSQFLEISVEKNGDCADTSGFLVLEPRQPITAAPTAVHALRANDAIQAESAGLAEHAGVADLATAAKRLDAPDGSPIGAVFVDNAGMVGIGTTAPTHTVHIASSTPTLALQDTDSTSQQAGYISYRDSGNVERAWVGYGTAGSPHFSILNARSSGNIELLPIGGGKVTIGPHFATAGDENLRIIRGLVREDGVVLQGSGFTATRTAIGRFTITFNTPFASFATVTVTTDALSCGGCIVQTAGVSSTAANIVIQVVGVGFADANFHFIAVGPR